MTGGLFDPLGTDRVETRRGGIDGVKASMPRSSAPALAAVLMVAALAVLLVVSWLRDSGDRGQPVAVGPIERVQAPPRPAAPPPAPPTPPAAPADLVPAGASTGAGLPARADQDVEIQNGVRIVRPRRAASPPGGQTLSVPDPGPAR